MNVDGASGCSEHGREGGRRAQTPSRTGGYDLQGAFERCKSDGGSQVAAGESGTNADQGADTAGSGPVESPAASAASSVGGGAGKSDTPNTGNGQTATPDPLSVGVQTGFDLGWTMAGLTNDATGNLALADFERLLPSEHELARSPRAQLELVRLGCLLKTMDSAFPPGNEAVPISALDDLKADLKAGEPQWETVKQHLQTLHRYLLDYLVCAGRPILFSYQLGRSLHDTILRPAQAHANELQGKPRGNGRELPQTSAALTGAFERGRIATLQNWLAMLEPHFPDQGASVVNTSLGRWSDWVTAALVEGTPGKLKGSSDEKGHVVDQAAKTLLSQGDVWLNILVGTQSLAGLLTPEAEVAAGEEAIRRSARIVRRVAWHYWAAILAVVLTAVGLTWFSGVELGGAGKVWTQIATIGGSLGITAKGIGSRVAKLADAGEKPIYRAASVDALAWAVTTLPQTKLSIRGVHALRRAGIPASVPLGRA